MTSFLPRTSVLLRTGDKGEPSLLLGTTSHYSWLYDDQGSGARMDVTIYRPTPTDTSFSVIGDYAQSNYSPPTGSSLIVKAINDDPDAPLLKPPANYSLIWGDQGSGGHNDGSVWYAVPPDNYISIGYVGQTGYNAPTGLPYACIRHDLVQTTGILNTIWTDAGSGARQDVSLFTPVGVPNAFVAQANYNPWSGTAYQLKGM